MIMLEKGNNLINEYVNKLIDNLPDEITKNKTKLSIDIVLDGGAFNGSYLTGALYFLKEMERRNYIKVNRISGCSVGSAAAYFYLLDRLDLMEYFHNFAVCQLQTNYCLEQMINLEELLKDKIKMPLNICQMMNKKLFITYNNIKEHKTIVKCTYKNSKDILETIVRSCYVPFLVSNNLLYKDKYMDGINPYVFSINKHKNRKILYLDLFGYDKFKYLVNVKNEKSGFHRTLSGLLDIHNFYIKQSSTEMCSYVNDWSIINKSRNFIKKRTEQVILYIVYFIVLFKRYIPCEIENSLLYKILSKITYEIYLIILQTYCL